MFIPNLNVQMMVNKRVSSQYIQQRGFAGAGGAEHASQFPRPELTRHVPQYETLFCNKRHSLTMS